MRYNKFVLHDCHTCRKFLWKLALALLAGHKFHGIHPANVIQKNNTVVVIRVVFTLHSCCNGKTINSDCHDIIVTVLDNHCI